MKQFRYSITDPEGIHARPAGKLVKVSKQFQSAIAITKEEKSADAKRIFGIMGLGVKQSQEIQVTAEGEDEEEAIAALENFLKENL